MKVTYNEAVRDNEVVLVPVFCQEVIQDDLCNVNEELRELFEAKIFEGKKNQTYFIRKKKNYLLIGLEDKETITDKEIRKLFGEGLKVVKKMGFKRVSLMCFNPSKIGIVVESLILADYVFDQYQFEKKDHVSVLNVIKEGMIDREMIQEHVLLAESTIIARDLSNEPANILTPVELADRAKGFGEDYGFVVEVLDKAQIEKEGMKAYLSVAAASDQEPRFIIMRYRGDELTKKTYGFVGKGLTYDAGGLSIKPTSGMLTMKDDMSGGSAVIGLMVACAKNKLKVNVTAVIAACENMISGRSYKPGDIIGTRGGKSIFIGNTDAEGRLTLVDAIDYILTKENVDSIVDIATLTGSALHCLGRTTSAVCTNNIEMYGVLERASEKSDERVWQMPIFDDYREQLKHHEADLKNVGGKPGMITAAAFIEKFVKEQPWIHIDIAGTSWCEKETGYQGKGATGVGVRLLYHYLKELIN
jgi:leucyl aminopeptidase